MDAREVLEMISGKSRWTSFVRYSLVILAFTAGCAKNKSFSVANNRPIIEGASPMGGDPSTGIVVQKPAGNRFVDRHPLFYKPGEYYTTTDGNVVVRGARATFVGIPAGFVGEFKQAFRGVPKTVIIQ